MKVIKVLGAISTNLMFGALCVVALSKCANAAPRPKSRLEIKIDALQSTLDTLIQRDRERKQDAIDYGACHVKCNDSYKTNGAIDWDNMTDKERKEKQSCHDKCDSKYPAQAAFSC